MSKLSQLCHSHQVVKAMRVEGFLVWAFLRELSEVELIAQVVNYEHSKWAVSVILQLVQSPHLIVAHFHPLEFPIIQCFKVPFLLYHLEANANCFTNSIPSKDRSYEFHQDAPSFLLLLTQEKPHLLPQQVDGTYLGYWYFQ